MKERETATTGNTASGSTISDKEVVEQLSTIKRLRRDVSTREEQVLAREIRERTLELSDLRREVSQYFGFCLVVLGLTTAFAAATASRADLLMGTDKILFAILVSLGTVSLLYGTYLLLGVLRTILVALHSESTADLVQLKREMYTGLHRIAEQTVAKAEQLLKRIEQLQGETGDRERELPDSDQEGEESLRSREEVLRTGGEELRADIGRIRSSLSDLPPEALQSDEDFYKARNEGLKSLGHYRQFLAERIDVCRSVSHRAISFAWFAMFLYTTGFFVVFLVSGSS